MRPLLGFLLFSTIIVGLGAVWLHRQWRVADAERIQLSSQLDVARSQRQGAIEQRAAAERERLIAERQRQDALQQRSAAERQRLNAEQQRQEALSQRSAAERERLNAETQRLEAVAQRSVAERERLNAEQQRQDAVQQRTVAERLRLLSVGQSLAFEVSRVLQRGDRALGSLLALQAYRFTVDNGGSKRDPEIFEAMRQSLFTVELAGHALLGHEDEVRAVHFLNDTDLVSTSDDGTLRRWDLATGQLDTILFRDTGRFQTIGLDPAHSRLVLGGSQGYLRVWPLPAETKPARLTPGATTGPGINSLTVLNSGEIAAGLLDGSVYYWTSQENQPVVAPTTASTEARSQPVVLWNEGPTLVWSDATGGLGLWDTSNPDILPTTIGRHLGQVTAIAPITQTRKLVAGLQSGDIVVWELDDLLATPVILTGHSSRITTLDVAADGILASGSLDNTIRLWNLADTVQPPITIDHGAWVWSIAFSSTGDLIASAGADRAVRLWPTRAEEIAETLCGALRRNFAHDEWMEFVGDDIPYEKTCHNLPGPETSHAHLE
ncbi:MAG: hypothetical protein HN712_25470 [Gemmatimonadetes bacterium]|jgi:WD40 repeat protein|nr:hypothetical protein [Gemmatimonadota bacterium]MBT6149563.1 hypothetical protein [Gemmatimonadota bacterium]MBT7863692.1 hypothetical protein [Gemmatimonadota bacterium]